MKRIKRNIIVALSVQIPIIIVLSIVSILCKLLGIEKILSLMLYGIIAVDIIASILLCWIINYNGYYDSLM